MIRKFCAYCEYRLHREGHIFCLPCYLELGGYDFRKVEAGAGVEPTTVRVMSPAIYH